MSANTDNLIAFAQAWHRLGDAVQEQVVNVWENGTDAEDVNHEAIALAIDRLPFCNNSGELRHALRSWLVQKDTRP
jgi:DNA-directed RNA polymerase specialized sigma24 family protein